MSYCIVFGFAMFLGWKLNKAVTLLIEVRNVKYIKLTIDKILETKDISLVSKQKLNDPDYLEFKKFKEMQEGV